LLDSEPVQVSAYSLPLSNADPIGANNIAASFHFTDGSIASLTYCTLGTKALTGERIEAFAPGIGAATQDFKSFRADGRAHRTFWPEKGYLDHLRASAAAIREGRDPVVTVRDGMRATIACLRLLESARSLAPSRIEVP